MSGHSHYATIKRQKAANDAAKGKVFSKMARIITIAVRTGGGGDADSNYKLRMAIDQARSVNMPKENIERAISKGVGSAANLEEVVYEGFGPEGVSIIVEGATDNRNRTAQEIKNIFERGGGNLAGPGAVSFNFESKGLIIVDKQTNIEDQLLKLIDAGVDDVQETDEGIDVYVPSDKLSEKSKLLKELGFVVVSAQLIQKPKTYVSITDASKATKLLNLLDRLEDSDDVQKVFANFDMPDEVLKQISG